MLGAHRTDDGRLQQQRTWLAREADGQVVQVLDFAVGQPLPVAQLTGSVISGRLLLHPGSHPRRAVFDEPPAAAGRTTGLPGAGTVDDALRAHGDLLASNPWLARAPVGLRSVLPTVAGAVGPGGPPGDPQGSCLPWAEGVPWMLLALTGGHECDLFGELEGGRLRPLSAVVAGELVAL